jgi:RNA polymerase sigma factor (sigma-70 family)
MPVREGTRRQPSELSDALLAQQSLAGDQRAFETLVQRYSTALFTFICRFLGDDDQACDILQQIFLQLSLSLPTLRIDDPLKSWLFQVARNRCRDELRRKRAVRFSELEWVNDEDEVSPLAAMLDPDPLPEE